MSNEAQIVLSARNNTGAVFSGVERGIKGLSRSIKQAFTLGGFTLALGALKRGLDSVFEPSMFKSNWEEFKAQGVDAVHRIASEFGNSIGPAISKMKPLVSGAGSLGVNIVRTLKGIGYGISDFVGGGSFKEGFNAAVDESIDDADRMERKKILRERSAKRIADSAAQKDKIEKGRALAEKMQGWEFERDQLLEQERVGERKLAEEKAKARTAEMIETSRRLARIRQSAEAEANKASADANKTEFDRLRGLVGGSDRHYERVLARAQHRQTLGLHLTNKERAALNADKAQQIEQAKLRALQNIDNNTKNLVMQ